MRTLAEDMLGIFNLERGMLCTLRELFLRPSAFLDEYFIKTEDVRFILCGSCF
ncbi:MAG: hypothetical protein MK081_04820 [Flavobacteriales bacterium]|nr:hypothetical protein [Flavobacteriales bacterium]